MVSPKRRGADSPDAAKQLLQWLGLAGSLACGFLGSQQEVWELGSRALAGTSMRSSEV